MLKNLSLLKEVKPDLSWAQDNREVLLAQIYNGQKEETTFGWFKLFMLQTERLAQPTPIALMIVLFFAISGLVGWNLADQEQPGDVLYFTKLAKEQVQMTVAMSDQQRASLNLQFAQKRAQEIAQLLAEPISPDKKARVQALAQAFKQELGIARENLSSVAVAKPKVATKAVAKAKATNNKQTVQSATVGKTTIGVDINLNNPVTSTVNQDTPLNKLDQAEQLFDQQDYNGAADKLKQADDSLK